MMLLLSCLLAILQGCADVPAADTVAATAAPYLHPAAATPIGNNLSIEPGALPLTLSAPETHFSGGTIVRVFGYQTPQGIDSVQLEFGANWRATPERLEQTAAVVADALLAHLRAAGYR